MTILLSMKRVPGTPETNLDRPNTSGVESLVVSVVVDNLSTVLNKERNKTKSCRMKC